MPMRSAYSSIQLSAAAGLALELSHQLPVAGPALVLVEQHHVQRRGVGAAVVGRMGPLLECGQLAVAHLVQDPAGVLVAEVVDPGPLPLPEHAKRRCRQLRGEGQSLQAGEDAVTTEHGHEPRQAGRGQAPSLGGERREAQRREVDKAAPVRGLERLPVALEAGRRGEPFFEVLPHARTRPFGAPLVLRFEPAARRSQDRRDHLQVRRPLTVRFDAYVEGQAVIVQTAPARRWRSSSPA